MEARPRAGSPRGERLAQIGPGLALAGALFAYWPLLQGALQISGDYGIQGWFFRPAELPPLLVLGAAGWMLWRRRERLFSLPAHPSWALASSLIALAAAFFVWALLTRAADLLLLSLAAHLLGFAASTRGRPGCRAVLLPALVLLLGVRIPAPLLNELVWHLQLWTAAGAAWILEILGRDVLRAGVVLNLDRQTHTFQVIEGCSGLRGIELLTLVALIVRELFGASAPRQWLIVLLAPLLGYALNLVRIALIAAGPDPQATVGVGADHTPQGLTVLVAGTGALYGLGWALSGGSHAGSTPAPRPGSARSPWHAPWRRAAAGLAVLGALTLSLPPFSRGQIVSRSRGAPTERIALPMQHAGWQGEDVEPDLLFTGPLYSGRGLLRRYEKKLRDAPRAIVEIFAALDTPDIPLTARLFSSKLVRPGADWTIEQSRTVHQGMLGQDVELALAFRPLGPTYAVVYHWRLRDEGLWEEAWHSLLAFDASPFRPARARAVVRLVTPVAHGGPLVRDRGKRVMDRFIADFQDVLANL